MKIRSHLAHFTLIYIMTIAVTMATNSQLAGIRSYFMKWEEHTEYTLPVTSLQFIYQV